VRRNRDPTTRFDLILAKKRYSVESSVEGRDFLVSVEGRDFRVRLEDQPRGRIRATVNGEERMVFMLEETASTLSLKIGGKRLAFERPPALLPSHERVSPPLSAQAGLLLSPLPGSVVSIEVEEGDEVELGTPLVTIEAMKMESIIRADRRAKIREIVARKGESVRKGQALLSYE
jgi:propionyl-CoA carboxylase alpha chain